MSSIDMLLTVYAMANIKPSEPYWADRDRIIISNGHISPAVYSTLGLNGFFPLDDAIAEYRLAGSIFEGHIEREVPGVEWTSGNLGQGLSAGCGFALAARLHKKNYQTFVLMGDGEQQKGQISEARRFAVKYKLNQLTAIIDYNQLQIGGSIHTVMPQDIKANWVSDGWQVLEIDGHNLQQIHDALHQAVQLDSPVMILAHTVMGKGIPFMENQAKYHGAAISESQLVEAMLILGQENRHDYYQELRNRRNAGNLTKAASIPVRQPHFHLGTPMLYTSATDNRSAWGKAIAELAELNKDSDIPLVVFDCDLQGSVKTNEFEQITPNHFFQGGIMEHNIAVVSGALSTENASVWWADFGMFGIDEVYNQHRLNDINKTNLKVITTHVGLDVGEDGRTHQCIDYIGLMRNLYHFRLLCPADPNQTDRIIRWLANQTGNWLVCMGRSKLPVILKSDGSAFYDTGYVFRYGQADLLRDGSAAAIVVTGTPVGNALAAADMLAAEGIQVQLWYVSSPLYIDGEMLASATGSGSIITIEDHNVRSGLGISVADRLIELRLNCRLYKLGVGEYPVSGTSKAVYQWAGLNPESIVQTVKQAVKNY